VVWTIRSQWRLRDFEIRIALQGDCVDAETKEHEASGDGEKRGDEESKIMKTTTTTTTTTTMMCASAAFDPPKS
tara:strand:- start:2504 stop:2725 length:222 start_codon:yes stop_codon:yes gene_type:complete